MARQRPPAMTRAAVGAALLLLRSAAMHAGRSVPPTPKPEMRLRPCACLRQRAQALEAARDGGRKAALAAQGGEDEAVLRAVRLVGAVRATKLLHRLVGCGGAWGGEETGGRSQVRGRGGRAACAHYGSCTPSARRWGRRMPAQLVAGRCAGQTSTGDPAWAPFRMRLTRPGQLEGEVHAPPLVGAAPVGVQRDACAG